MQDMSTLTLVNRRERTILTGFDDELAHRSQCCVYFDIIKPLCVDDEVNDIRR
jgi:hypothetical protein